MSAAQLERRHETNCERTAGVTYTISFPVPNNYKFVCLVHADMTGVVHVLGLSETLPHDQNCYDRQAQAQQLQLLDDASRLERRGTPADGESDNEVAAGAGEVIATGAGSQTASLMQFVRSTIVVRVGDTVVWTSLDPSINHTVTFGVEPSDPRPPLGINMTPAPDGARLAVISSPTDSYICAVHDQLGMKGTVIVHP